MNNLRCQIVRRARSGGQRSRQEQPARGGRVRADGAAPPLVRGAAGGRGSPLQQSGGARDTTLGSSSLAQLARSARGRSTPLRAAAQLPALPPCASGSRGRRSSVPPAPTASSDAVGSALVAGFAGLGALPPAPLAQAAGVDAAVPARRGGFGGAFSPAPAKAAAAKAPVAPFPAFNIGAPASAPHARPGAAR
jgi:hypothetical protein